MQPPPSSPLSTISSRLRAFRLGGRSIDDLALRHEVTAGAVVAALAQDPARLGHLGHQAVALTVPLDALLTVLVSAGEIGVLHGTAAAQGRFLAGRCTLTTDASEVTLLAQRHRLILPSAGLRAYAVREGIGCACAQRWQLRLYGGAGQTLARVLTTTTEQQEALAGFVNHRGVDDPEGVWPQAEAKPLTACPPSGGDWRRLRRLWDQAQHPQAVLAAIDALSQTSGWSRRALIARIGARWATPLSATAALATIARMVEARQPCVGVLGHHAGMLMLHGPMQRLVQQHRYLSASGRSSGFILHQDAIADAAILHLRAESQPLRVLECYTHAGERCFAVLPASGETSPEPWQAVLDAALGGS